MWSVLLGAVLAAVDAGVAWRSWDGARRIARIRATSGTVAGDVTVVVPARNEARNIAASVQSVLGQTGVAIQTGAVRLVVVDDDSTDDTAQLARAAGASEVVTLQGPPAGWAGKNYALARGAQGALSEWLAFLDADVRLGVGALAALLAFAEGEGLDLLSLGSSQSAPSVAWPLVTPVGLQLILSQAAPDGVGQRRALAVGHFILVRRAVYERVGGYAAIKGSTADDVDFATLVRDSGGRTQFAWGDGWVISTQLASWGELWGSWRKSFQAGTGGSAPAMLAGGLGFVAWGVAPLLLLLRSRHGAARRLALAALVLQAAGRRVLDRQMHVPPVYAPSTPLARVVLGGILLDAGARALQGQPSRWKGRSGPGAPHS